MRKLSTLALAGLLAAAPVLTVAQAQTITQSQGTQDNFGYGPGFYILGGLALVGVTLGIIAIVDENNHHHHFPHPVSP